MKMQEHEALKGIYIIKIVVLIFWGTIIESFFKTLKIEVVYQLEKQIEADNMYWLISEFIGHYNHDRPHSTNDYLSPNQFEQIRLNEIYKIELCLGTK